MPKLGSFGAGTLTFGSDLTRRAHGRRQPAAARARPGCGAAPQRYGSRRPRRGPRRCAQRPFRDWRRASRLASARRPASPSTICIFRNTTSPDYGLPWINSAPVGNRDRAAQPGAAVADSDSNYYGFRRGNTCAPMSMWRRPGSSTTSTATSQSATSCAMPITPPASHYRAAALHAASANGNGTSGTAALIAPGTPLGCSTCRGISSPATLWKPIWSISSI